jgi:hypothetical protein
VLRLDEGNVEGGENSVVVSFIHNDGGGSSEGQFIGR